MIKTTARYEWTMLIYHQKVKIADEMDTTLRQKSIYIEPNLKLHKHVCLVFFLDMFVIFYIFTS